MGLFNAQGFTDAAAVVTPVAVLATRSAAGSSSASQPSGLALLSSQQVNGSGTGAMTTTAITVAAGDLLVVKIATENDTAIPATPSAAGQTFVQHGFSNAAGHCACAIYTATVAGNPGTLTITEQTTGQGGVKSIVVERWGSAQLDATPVVTSTTVTSANGCTGTLVTEGTGSVVTWLAADYSAITPGTPGYRSGATQDGLHTSGGAYTVYYATQPAAGGGAPGSQTFGTTTPAASAIWTLIAVEVEAAIVLPDKYGAATLPVTATATTTGQRFPLSMTSTPVAVTATRAAGGTSNYTGTGVADPWGGYWPGPTNTGVPSGTVLTAYSGPSTITTAGTVIDSKLISVGLVIEANNVTIRNCLSQCGAYWNVLNSSGATNLQIIDTEIDGMNNMSNDSGVSGDYTLLRCNIHGTGDGVKVGNVTIQDCYFHDLAIPAGGDHNDGAQSLGTTGANIIHNYFKATSGWTSCVMMSTGSADQIRNVLIQRNLFASSNYSIYGGYMAGVDTLSKVSNVQILDNRWDGLNPPGSGPLASVDPPAVTHTGNSWLGGPNNGQALD